MNFEYSSDEVLLKKTVREMFKKEFPLTKVRSFMEGEANNSIDPDLINLISEQGLLGTISWDDKNHKMDGVIYSVLISYETGRAVLPFPLIENQVASYLLNRYGKESIVDELSEGKKTITIAWETNEINVEELNGHFILNGSFLYVPFAAQADLAIIKCELNSGESVLSIINLRDNEVTISKKDSFDETYPLYDITVTNYEITPTDLIGEVGNGENEFEKMRQLGCLLLSAEMLGGAEELLKVTVNYANERTQFGQPISKFQALKHLAAEMYVLLDSGKSALDYATWCVESNNTEELEKVISLLKSYSSETSNKISGIAIQIHGGMGYTWESDVHLYFKRARRSSVMLGDSYYHREKIANYILGKG